MSESTLLWRRSRRKRRRRSLAMRFLRTLASGVFLALAVALFLRWNNASLQVTRWEASFSNLPEGFDGCRIVVLGDLHGASFGRENARLFRTVARQKPDWIFFVGDLEDGLRGPVPGYPEEIADGLSAIAPVFYVTGNHEWAIGSVPELKARLAEHGVTVLTNTFQALERNGDTLLLAGVDDPNGWREQKTPQDVAEEVYAAWENPFWILLAHRNTLFPVQYYALGSDLVISGHGHGGLIRLPFTDGLVSTDRTLFPSWTAGFYEKDGSRLFVTRGLGNSGKTFRLFNRPEVAVLTLRRG